MYLPSQLWFTVLCLLIYSAPALPQTPPLRDRGPVQAGLGGAVDPRYLPPGPPRPNRWRLGLRVQYRDIGALITQIVPGSAAGRAGLEPGDVVINVAGYQVGYVDGVLYDLAEECFRRADERGVVQLLLRNGRNGQLVNAPLQLDPWNSGRIGGTLATDSPNFFSNSAVTVVRLVEAPRWGGRPTVLSEEQVRSTGRFPLSFELDYNPAELGAGDRRYGLEAEIVDRGKVLFRTRGMTEFRPGERVSLFAYRTGEGQPPSNWFPANPVNEIATWYQRYFDRPPGPNAVQHYLGLAQRGYSIRDIRIQMLASTEFFEHCGGDVDRFLLRSFEKVRGQRPSPQEFRHIKGRFDHFRGNRPNYVRELFDTTR